MRTLVLAWGNAGRLDDGLGPQLADAILALGLPDIDVMSEYQLHIEHAWDVAQYDRVIFADASRTGDAPFALFPLFAEHTAPSYSSHELSPGTVLSLSQDLYGLSPESWIIGIRGYEFDGFAERLSTRARDNLRAAVRHLGEALRAGALLGTVSCEA